MPPSQAEQIRGSLETGRREADRILLAAEAQARAAQARGADVERNVAATQLLKLEAMRAQLESNQQRIDEGCVRLVEMMALASMRLLEAARQADFSLPPWPGGIGRTVEIKLSETREVTFRFARGESGPGPGREGI